MADALEEQIKSLSLTNSNDSVTEKHQQYMAVRNTPPLNPLLRFEDQKLLGGFQITENLKYAKNMNIPHLISVQSIKELKGTYLGEKFDDAIKMSDYKAYHELKQEFFLKWLIEENYHKDLKAKKCKQPHFICFGGRITDPLMTPEIPKFGNWKIYAAKLNDVIYLWDEKENHGSCDLLAYYGVYFEHLLTHADPKTSKVNEFDKIFAINEITFGSHQLLCLSELDAQTENNEWAEIKAHKSCHPTGMYGKLLKFWAQSIVPGVKKIIIGKHKDGLLENIEITSIDTLGKKNHLEVNECYNFQDRLLKFINTHFSINNPNIVKTFSWRDGDFNVKVDSVPEECIPKSMLPQWYIDAVINQFGM